MDPERAALADQPVEEEPDLLGDLVVLDEELLELVDDEQDAGEGAASGHSSVSR